MLIRVILLSALLLIGWRLFLRRSKLPVHIVVVFGLLATAGLMVVFAEATNHVAHFVGVGRGADLVTYLVEVGILYVIAHYYTKFVELQRQLTELVREIALLRAELEDRAPAPTKAGTGAAPPSEKNRPPTT